MAIKKRPANRPSIYDFDTKLELKQGIQRSIRQRKVLEKMTELQFKQKYELVGVSRKQKIKRLIRQEKIYRKNLLMRD